MLTEPKTSIIAEFIDVTTTLETYTTKSVDASDSRSTADASDSSTVGFDPSADASNISAVLVAIGVSIPLSFFALMLVLLVVIVTVCWVTKKKIKPAPANIELQEIRY